MHQIPNKVDFYITNVCNLTCPNCNRFNNHNFTGWQRWSDYEDIYQAWAQKVKLPAVTIMGGEPLLNPTIGDWFRGTAELFNCDVQILTNGTRFEYIHDLYPDIVKYKVHFAVSVHNVDEFKSIRENILGFLQGPVTQNCDVGGYNWTFVDKNNVIVNAMISNRFFAAAIQPHSDGGLTLHNNNPKEAHNNCAFAQWKSYHFIRGKLFKCGPVALLPEFDQQTPLRISDEDRELLYAYKPLTVDNYDEYSSEFFENLDNVLPQCKFCSVSGESSIIAPIRKGSIKISS